TTKSDTYYVVVSGFNGTDPPPLDPFTAGTGAGAGSTGAYGLTITSEAVGPGAIKQADLEVKPGQTVLVQVQGAAASTGDFHLEITNLDQFLTPLNSTLLFPAGNLPAVEAVAGSIPMTTDLNGDGHPDVVVSDSVANLVSVLINNGDGTFQAPRQFAI